MAGFATRTMKQIGGIVRWKRVELFLALALLITPFILMLFDDEFSGFRGSISAYYDISIPQAFYVPLTIVAMLFVVNGFLKDAHQYNIVLGVALLGVIIFDKDGSTARLHEYSTYGFFVGNVLVVVFLSEINLSTPNLGIGIKVATFVGMAAIGYLVWEKEISVLTGEWAAMALITVHFVFDSMPGDTYKARKRIEWRQVVPVQSAPSPVT